MIRLRVVGSGFVIGAPAPPWHGAQAPALLSAMRPISARSVEYTVVPCLLKIRTLSIELSLRRLSCPTISTIRYASSRWSFSMKSCVALRTVSERIAALPCARATSSSCWARIVTAATIATGTRIAAAAAAVILKPRRRWKGIRDRVIQGQCRGPAGGPSIPHLNHSAAPGGRLGAP